MTDQSISKYLDYLPVIHHEDDFLGEFLLPFEQIFAGFGRLLSTIDRYFAPALTDPDFLPWLASWVALVLDEEWDETKRRRLIAEAVELYRWRGSVKGLKQYLEIYTGLMPEIREWVWPGGMQIGVESRIGGPAPDQPDLPPRIPPDDPDNPGKTLPATILSMKRERSENDYYVVEIDVETVGDLGQPQQESLVKYYLADNVHRVDTGVEAGENYVVIERQDGFADRYQPATVSRRDGLIHSFRQFTLETRTETETQAIDYKYIGDTYLVGELVDVPYRFIVDVRVPSADIGKVKLDKVRAIVDTEKPAHTVYFLKLTPVVSVYVLEPMQIGVRSTIEVDTIIG